MLTAILSRVEIVALASLVRWEEVLVVRGGPESVSELLLLLMLLLLLLLLLQLLQLVL